MHDTGKTPALVNTHNDWQFRLLSQFTLGPTKRTCEPANAHAQSDPVLINRAFMLLPEVATQLVVIDCS